MKIMEHQNVPQIANLQELVHYIKEEMGERGLEDANVDKIIDLMERYTSQAQDWESYAMFDEGRYTRNLVDDGNGKFNLMILCWPGGVERYFSKLIKALFMTIRIRIAFSKCCVVVWSNRATIGRTNGCPSSWNPRKSPPRVKIK